MKVNKHFYQVDLDTKFRGFCEVLKNLESFALALWVRLFNKIDMSCF